MTTKLTITTFALATAALATPAFAGEDGGERIEAKEFLAVDKLELEIHIDLSWAGETDDEVFIYKYVAAPK